MWLDLRSSELRRNKADGDIGRARRPELLIAAEEEKLVGNYRSADDSAGAMRLSAGGRHVRSTFADDGINAAAGGLRGIAARIQGRVGQPPIVLTMESLAPLLVCTRTTAPAPRPNSAEKLFVST